MKTKETIKSELFDHFAGGTLPNEYYECDKVCQIMKEANEDWENAEPENADKILDKAADEIAKAWYGGMLEPMNEDNIDHIRLLQEYGINIDSLRENGDLERMLNYGRSSLLTGYPVIGGVCFPMQMKLSLRERSDGMLAVIPHPIRKEPNLKDFRGYKFTKEDRKNLLETGNLGHTIEVDSRLLGFRAEVYLSLDRDTNEIVMMKTNAVHVPHSVFGIELNDEQKRMLESGAEVHVSGTNDIGLSCEYLVQVNAERRRFIAKTRS